MNNFPMPEDHSVYAVPPTQALALDRAIEALEDAAVRGELDGPQRQRLALMLGAHLPGQDDSGEVSPLEAVVIDSGFDLAAELGGQLSLLRAMQASLLDVDGRLAPGKSIREVRESLTAANTLYGTLLKNQEKMLSQSRIQAVIRTAAEVLREVDPAAHERYFSLLEERLASLT